MQSLDEQLRGIRRRLSLTLLEDLSMEVLIQICVIAVFPYTRLSMRK
jgi:hypothetical protein